MMTQQYKYKVLLEGDEGFILDTDLLDTGLLGYLSKDVTEYVQSVSVRRGKSTNLDEFTAGQMSVVFNNLQRVFDPDYTSSPIYGAVLPRKVIRFSMAVESSSIYGDLFVGYVDDWNFDYDVSGNSVATASCSDLFTLFANQNIILSSPPAELSGERISRVLTNPGVNYTGGYAFDGQAFTMNSVSYTGNALAYIQQVALSESGYFFISGRGDVIFKAWNSFAIGIDPLVFTDQDDGSGIPFVSIETTYGTEQLYNYVTVAGSGGTVTSQNTTSQATYGVASESFDVITSGTAQMQVLADYVISNYKDPRFRISQISVSLDDPKIPTSLSGYGLTAVLRQDIGDQIQVIWTPNQIGTAVSRQGFVIGKSINATPGACTMSFNISSNDYRSTYP